MLQLCGMSFLFKRALVEQVGPAKFRLTLSVGQGHYERGKVASVVEGGGFVPGNFYLIGVGFDVIFGEGFFLFLLDFVDHRF